MRRVKAISLYQPWASAVAWGLKRVETRDWSTPYRGLLVIHAAKHFTEDERLMCGEYPFEDALRERRMTCYQLPRGVALCIVELFNVVATDVLVQKISRKERVCGNYAPGRYGWVLEMVKVFDTPIPLRGMPGLFDVDLDALGEAKARETSQQLRLL